MTQSAPLLPSLVERDGSRPQSRGEGSPDKTQDDVLSLPPAFGMSTGFNSTGMDNTPSGKSQDDRFQEFLARQVNSSQEVRLEMALFQREALEKMRATSASVKLQGVDAFQQLLRHRFGTITAAWRQLFDPAAHGKVSFSDFCQCCRDLGFQRKMKALWNELDTDHRGWITLDHLDPASAQCLREFRSVACAKHGGLLKAWFWFDVNKNHRVDLKEFVDQCKEMEYHGDARLLFTCLKMEISRNFLTIQDFDEKSMQCLYRGDLSMMTVKGGSGKSRGLTMPRIDDSPSSPERETMNMASTSGFQKSSSTSMVKKMAASTGSIGFGSPGGRRGSNLNSRWTKQLSTEQIQAREEKEKDHDEADMGLKCLHALKRQLIAQFGSIYGAWRQALDLDGNNRLSFGELCEALRKVGYSGNVKNLWIALDQDNDGFVKLNDLDSKIHEELTSYRKLVLQKYPHMLAVWRESLDIAGSGQIDEATFVKHCKELNWPYDARSLFHSLKEDRSRKFMLLRDYDLGAYNCFGRGDMEMLSEDNGNIGKLQKMSFNERQDSCFSQRWARMKSKTDRAEMERVHKENKSKDQGAHSADSLRIMLIRRFKTMTTAWRHGLDVNDIGRLPFNAFCDAMRRLGFNGNMRETFAALDTEGKGSVTLKDFDLEAFEILKEFRTLLLEKHGNYIKAWKVMDADGNGIIDEHEMADSCQVIGYTKDPLQLFKYLLDGPSKKHITMADIDPTAMRAYWRGELEAMSPVDKAKQQLAARQKADQEMREKRMEACDWRTLKKALVRMYGTITAAWRNGLDIFGNGKVSFHDFSKQVRNLGFSGNIQRVFRELDHNESGVLTFNEVDPEWYSRLSQFHQCLHAKFKSFQSAWATLDDTRSNSANIDDFVQLCLDIGYQEDPKALYKQLLQSSNYIHLALQDLEMTEAIVSANHEDMSYQQLHKRDSTMLTGEQKAKSGLQKRQAQLKSQKSLQIGATNWATLKEMLIRKYGTITAAWRHGLDWGGNGKLSFMEFSRACRDNSFMGNIERAFGEIDLDNSGVATFDEVDHDWFMKLKLFRELLLQTHQTYEKAWEELDCNKNNMCEYVEFQKVCSDIGYRENSKALFKQLLKDHGRRFLTLEDFDMGNMLVGRALNDQAAHRASRVETTIGLTDRKNMSGSPKMKKSQSMRTLNSQTSGMSTTSLPPVK